MTQPFALPRPSRPGPVVMGIVNVTPDSFSDGGRWASTDLALEHATTLLADGADLLDVGGESTRPGATRPVPAEELDRVVPVITELARRGVAVSVDTMRAEVAAAAVAAGAVVVNDVSGGLSDPEILDVVAQTGAVYVAMHWRAHSERMQEFTHYPEGVVVGVRRELAARVEAALAAGVREEQLVLDPGLGFAKTADQNWELTAGLDAVESLGFPVLVGASRKSFLGSLLAAPDGTPRPIAEREHAGVALSLLLAQRGVWSVRVHDVRATTDALAVWRRLAPTAPEEDA
ncbi:dihydropteroate synthase [Nocardioides daphniae]|uniref:Dihydropteroate synthase n=1 Tax=Nocardioides daphniae TaxID=402297 RepID=A0ABQ1Q4R2_9ACTN|nr:dihydropteroate synthase [Nocardioides daphniae]GGD13866.1 dihydropteroate synthase [Nocardioides daphniae]